MSLQSLLTKSAELYSISTGSQNEYNVPSFDFPEEANATFDVSLHPKTDKITSGSGTPPAIQEYTHKIFSVYRTDIHICDRLKIDDLWYEVLGTTDSCGRAHHLKIFAKKIEVQE